MGMVRLRMLGSMNRKISGHAAQRGAVARCHFQQLPQVLHEQDEGEERAPEEGVREHFIPDVAGENAHRVTV